MLRNALDWKLPPEIEARLGENSFGRQRAIFEAGHLLIILHAAPRAATLERETQVFLRRPDGALIASGALEGGAALRALLGEYRTHWEECDREYDVAESADELFQLLEKLAPLNRASTNLANALQAARDQVKEDKFLIGVRDESGDISRAFDLLVTDAKLKLDYRIAKNAELNSVKADEMAAAQHKLNVLAAMTFPIMSLATVLGMNLTHGLENEPNYVFVGVLICGVAVGLLVKRWVAK